MLQDKIKILQGSKDPYQINVDGVQNRKKFLYQIDNIYAQEPFSKDSIFIESGANLQELNKEAQITALNNQKDLSYNNSDHSYFMKQSSIQGINEKTNNNVEVKDFEDENAKNHNETDATYKSIHNSPQSYNFKYAKNDKERKMSRLAQNRKSFLESKYIVSQKINTISGLKSQHLDQQDFGHKTQAITEAERDKEHGEQSNSYNKIIAFFYIYRFLKANLLKSLSHNLSLLTISQYQTINDKSVYIKHSLQKQLKEQELQKHNNIFEKFTYLRDNQFQIQNQSPSYGTYSFCIKQIGFTILNMINQILKKFKIISPNNSFLMIWDLIFIFNSLFLIIIYPFYISFDEDGFLTETLQQMQQISLLSIIFDIFLGFHTGIYEFGEIVLQRDKIYKYYINKRFFTDLICISLLMYGIFQDIEVMTFIALIFRYKQMIEKLSRISCNLQLKQKLSTYYDLIKLVGYISLVIHFFGCGFYYVGVKSKGIEKDMDNWIINVGIQHNGLFDKYVFSIYFIMITMITIGYGDIHPVNKIEKMYTMSVAFIMCGLFAFTINLIGTIITETHRKYNEFSRKQTVISKYLVNRQIDNKTQIRVFKYLEYLDDSQEENTYEGILIIIFECSLIFDLLNKGQKILQLCSKDIRDDILKDHYGKVINKCSIIKDTFSKEFIEALSLKMQERTFAPGEVILERGVCLKNLYFIIKGETEYYFNRLDHQQSICQNEQKVIDIRVFLSQQASDISIRSKGITIVSYIENSSFLEILQQFQIDKEKYFYLKDQFLNDQRYQHPCKSCGQFKHNIFDCPQLSYQVNKVLYLDKMNCSINQVRNGSIIRKHCKLNTLLLNQKIRFEVRQFRYQLVTLLYGEIENNETESKFFTTYDDKEFFQLLPKINIQRYFKLYRKRQSDFHSVFQQSLSQSVGEISENSLSSSEEDDDESDFNSDESESDSQLTSEADEDTCSISKQPFRSSNGNIESNQTRSSQNLQIQSNQKASISDMIEPSINLIKPEDVDLKSEQLLGDRKNLTHIDRSQGEIQQIEKRNYFQSDDIKESSEKKIPYTIVEKSVSGKKLISQAQLSQGPDSILKNSVKKEEKKLKQLVKDLQLKRKVVDFIYKKNIGDQGNSLKKQKTTAKNLNVSLKNIKGAGSNRSINSKSSLNNINVKENNNDLTNGVAGKDAIYERTEMKKRTNYIYQIEHMQKIMEFVQQIVGLSNKPNNNTKQKPIQTSRNIQKKKTTFALGSDTENRLSNQLSYNNQLSISENILKTNGRESLNEGNQFTKEDDNFFGKCGSNFEYFKEYQYYYPKFNYSIVIRSFKKHKQLEQKLLNRQQQPQQMVRKLDSIKHQDRKKRPKAKSSSQKRTSNHTNNYF